MKRAASILAVVFLFIALFSTAHSAPKEKEWTFAVFINADNDLDEFAPTDQEQMSRVGSNEWLNIVTLLDGYRTSAAINYIEKDKITRVKSLGEIDMGDYKQLVNFMKFVVKEYPAKRYALIIWNHGTGWKNRKNAQIFKGISEDESSGNSMTIPQLRMALDQIKNVIGRNIDIFNMDACLMQMVEVVYACHESCDFVIASEDVEPCDGAPYDDILNCFSPKISTLDLCKNWVKAFVDSYSNGSQGTDNVTQSAIICSGIPDLIDAINGFAKAIMSGKYSNQVLATLSNVQRFEYPENIDLIHFVKLMKKQTQDITIQTAADKLLAAATAAIAANGYHGSRLKNSNGLAIYLPVNLALEANYQKLEFAKKTLWDDMIPDLSTKDFIFHIIRGIESGDCAMLRSFVAISDDMPAAMVRIVVREINYRVYTEGGLPEHIVNEVSSLIKELSSRLR